MANRRPIKMKLDTRGAERKFALAGSCVREKIAKATSVTSIFVQNIAKQLAPVDTGRLRSSIQIERFLDGLVQTVGSDVEYAGHVEFGTEGSLSQPFLRPAIEAQLTPHRKRLKRAIAACF